MILLVWISYSGHVRHTQTIKTTCNILEPNSKLGIFICVRFGIIFQCRDLSIFSGGVVSCWATIHWKPHRVLGKRSGSWQDFSSYKSFGRIVFGYPSGKKRSLLDTDDKRYFWPRNKSVRTRRAPMVRTEFRKHFPWRQGGNLKTASSKISHPVQVRADWMLIPWCNGIKPLG